MKQLTITITIDKETHQEIETNLKNLSHSLGRKINKSALVRHLLKQVKTKKDLYDLGFITYDELHNDTSTPYSATIKRY